MSATSEFYTHLSNILEYLQVFALSWYYGIEYIVQRFINPFATYKDLSNEIILVTGSGRGIGHELCLELSRTGAKIVCWSRSSRPNEELLQKIKLEHGRAGIAYAYTVDVGDRRQVQEAAELVKKDVGDVTMIINNAGVMKVQSIMDTTEPDIQEMFKVNLLSNFWVIQAFLPAMMAKGSGHIVTINSAAGILPTYSIATYSATKHGQQGLIEALRQEIGHHPLKPNIKFSTAYPFYCSTEMLEHSIPNTRIPALLPILTPRQVSVAIVDGIRREHEYIYIPKLIGWLGMFSWLMTLKAINAHGDFLELHIDPKQKSKL